MTFWLIFAGILLLFWLLCQIRIGAAVAYSRSGFFLTIFAGPIRIPVFPSTKGKTRKKSKKTKKNSVEEDSSKETGQKSSFKDTLSIVQRFLPLVGEAAGRFKRKIRIDRVNMSVIWGASDPASAAKGFGAANAAMGILWPVIEHNFNVKERNLRVDVDFDRSNPEFIGDFLVSITIGQCFSLSLLLGIKALMIFGGIRREKNQKEKIEKAVQT